MKMSEEEELKAQIGREPENWVLRRQLGYLYSWKGRYTEAVREYVKYIEESGGDGKAREALAWVITKRLKELRYGEEGYGERLLHYLVRTHEWTLGVGKPSLVYSILLSRFTWLVGAYGEGVPKAIAEAYVGYVEAWGVEHFREEDYQEAVTEKGGRYDALREQVMRCVEVCARGLEDGKARRAALEAAMRKAQGRAEEVELEEVELSEEQRAALLGVEEFLRGDGDVFLLRGYAGTGKTTLVRHILRFLRRELWARPHEVVAPTGRAAKVLREKCGEGATIHRAIYKFEDLEEGPGEGETVVKMGARMRVHFGLKSAKWEALPVVIADEASMISSKTQEGERFQFGSGNVLDDLLEYGAVGRGGKILFVGDPAQLPPVGEVHSRALEAATFEARGLKVREVELRTIFRQETGGVILRNAGRLRDNLELPKAERKIFSFENKAGRFEKTDVGAVVDAMVESRGEDAIAIAFSNAAVGRINCAVRKRLFAEGGIPQVGDRLLFVRNAYDVKAIAWEAGADWASCRVVGLVDVYNGDRGEIVEVGEAEEHRTFVGKEEVGLVFRRLVIRHESGKFIAPMVVESLLNRAEPDLTEKEEAALFTDFKIRLRKEAGRESFAMQLREDPYFNAVRVKYGYAMTCHKSQGGAWKRVYVDFTGRNGLDEDSLRWGYTAVTRASERVFYMGRDEFSVYAKLEWSEIKGCKKLGACTIGWQEVGPTTFHGVEVSAAKRVKFRDVECRVPRGVEIESVRSNDYDEVYQFRIGEAVLRLKATHDALGIFGPFRVVFGEETEGVKRWVAALNRPVRHTFEVAYEPSTESLKNLHEMIVGICEEVGIAVAGVWENCKNYFVRYTFETAEWAQVHFNVNAKGQLTRVNAFSTRGTEDARFVRFYARLRDALSREETECKVEQVRERSRIFLQNIRFGSEEEKLAWLAGVLKTRLLGCGIVYTLTTSAAERVAAWLRQQGIGALAYYRAVTPTRAMSEEVAALYREWGSAREASGAESQGDAATTYRAFLEWALRENKLRVLVATNALGEGFEKPDVEFVIHYQRPKSVEEYAVQLGRAGRNGAPAYGVLLADKEGCGSEADCVAQYLIEHENPSKETVEEIVLRLREAGAAGLTLRELQCLANVRTAELEQGLKFLVEQPGARVLQRGERFVAGQGLATYEFPEKTLVESKQHRLQELERMRRYVETQECLLRGMCEGTDAADAERACGNCAQCDPARALPTEVEAEILREASHFLVGKPHVLEPLTRWADPAVSAKMGSEEIPASLAMREGRILSTYQVGLYGKLVAEGKYGSYPAHFDERLVEGVVAMIEGWGLESLPRWITAVPSPIVEEFAQRLATRLGIPYYASLRKSALKRPLQKNMQNATFQQRNVQGAFEYTEAFPRLPCFLVDDVTDSRWTLTIAAAKLRRMGVESVTPIALADSSHRNECTK